MIWFVIGWAAQTHVEKQTRPFSWDTIGLLVLNSGAATLMVAVAQGLGREKHFVSHPLFWTSIVVLVFPVAYVAIRTEIDRMERLVALIILGQFFHLLKVIHSPLLFSGFDEFLHWRTALDIVELRSLFTPNSLLPVSPLYPGLELVTTPLVELTGLSVFHAGLVVIAVSRFVMVAACFLLFEYVSGSARIAAMAVLVVMSSASFVGFHGAYAYESLAIGFFPLVLYCVFRLEADPVPRPKLVTLVFLLALGLVVTHHLTSYITAAVVGGASAVMLVRPVKSQPRGLLLVITTGLALTPPIWAWLISAPTGEYIGPHLSLALLDFGELASGLGQIRLPFEGVEVPILLRIMGIASVLGIGAGLLFGFFRTLTYLPPGACNVRGALPWCWATSGAVVLALLGACYPVTVAFKLTSTGWEVGNRLGTFAIVGAAFVCAVSVTHFWQARNRGKWSTLAVAGVLTIMIVGGLVNGWGVAAVRSGYEVGADGHSHEPLGISVAQWSRDALGEGNRFAADRANSVLLSTIGRQNVLSTLNGDPAVAGLFFNERLSHGERNTISRGFLDFILVDLRLTSAAPGLGLYYEPGDFEQYGAPRLRELLKFDSVPDVNRVLDAGAIVVFDVRKLRS